MDEITIYEAASSNNVDALRKALAGEYGVISAEDLELALLRASANGHLECVSLLLENKVNMLARTGGGDTALILASQNGHIDVVKKLIQCGCPVNCENSMGDTALMKVCEQGHVDIAKVLLQNGADESSQAVDDNKEVCSNTPNGTLHPGLRKHMPHGYTSLMVAVLKQSEHYQDLVQLLIQAKAPVNEEDFENCTVLHHAAKVCSPDVLEMLLVANADVNAQDVWGMTPIMYAATYNKHNNVKVLLKYGADVSIKCRSRRTVLSIAVRTGSQKMIKDLLDAGADPEHKDAHANTPLFIAISHSNASAVKCLIQVGCDLNVTCRLLRSLQMVNCFECALWHKNLHIVEMLYKAGACTYQSIFNALANEELKSCCQDKPEMFDLLNNLVSVPRSLKSSCRIVIRKHCVQPILVCIDKFSLPTSLKNYLSYSDIVVTDS